MKRGLRDLAILCQLMLLGHAVAEHRSEVARGVSAGVTSPIFRLISETTNCQGALASKKILGNDVCEYGIITPASCSNIPQDNEMIFLVNSVPTPEGLKDSLDNKWKLDRGKFEWSTNSYVNGSAAWLFFKARCSFAPTENILPAPNANSKNNLYRVSNIKWVDDYLTQRYLPKTREITSIPRNLQAAPPSVEPQTTELTPAERAAINHYEKNKRYSTDGSQREYFPKDMFQELRGGNGKLMLAYFGPRRADLERMVENNELVGVRNYAYGSPEHKHAGLSGVQALGVDGLGRKITRYAMPPESALRSLIASPEVMELDRYLQAKRKQMGATNRPVDMSASFHKATGTCVGCHADKDYVANSAKTREGLQNHLKTMTSDQLDDMMTRARLSSEQVHAIRDFVARDKARQHSVSTSAPRTNAPVCFTDSEDQAVKTALVPRISTANSFLSGVLSAATSAGRLMFYDKNSVPKAWNTGIERRINSPEHHTNQNTTYPLMGYHGVAGMEFPWSSPAGMDAADNGSTEKFVIAPQSGPMMRAVTRTRQNSPQHFAKPNRQINVNGPMLGWIYNAGTTFGEILRVNGVPFEIRLRSKQRDGSWKMDVLRPFESAIDLAQGIARICATGAENRPTGCDSAYPAYQAILSPNATKLRNRTEFFSKQMLGTRRDPLSLSSTALEATVAAATLQELPELPPDLVEALLTRTPFKSVFGKPWTQGPPPGWAPTTQSHSSIVPKNYAGGLIPLTQEACMKCHDSAGRTVDHFDPKREDGQMFAPQPNDNQSRPRTWYDFVQGDDSILSFNPYSPSAVKNSALSDVNAINPCLKKHGLIQ